MLRTCLREIPFELSKTELIFHTHAHSIDHFSWKILVHMSSFNRHINKFLIDVH